MNKREPFLTWGWWLVVIAVSPFAMAVGAILGVALAFGVIALSNLLGDVATIVFVG